MIRTEFKTLVQRRPDEVFEYLANCNNLPQYDPWVESVDRTSDGPIRVGSTWTHVRRMGRRRIIAPIELVEYEPNVHLAIVSGSGGIEVRVAQTLASIGDGTLVEEVLQMNIRGPLRLLEPLIGRSTRQQGQEVHRRLKKRLESG